MPKGKGKVLQRKKRELMELRMDAHKRMLIHHADTPEYRQASKDFSLIEGDIRNIDQGSKPQYDFLKFNKPKKFRR